MRRLFNLVHRAFHEPGTHLYHYVQGVVWAMIALSVGLFLVDLALGPDSEGSKALESLDIAILWFFAVEISLRILSYRPPNLAVFNYGPAKRLRYHLVGRLLYCLQPMTMIDILTVAALVPALRGLRALRLLRLLRTANFFRYSKPFHGLARSFRENALLFGLAFSFLGTAVLVGGLSIYLIEARENPSIHTTWDGLWWALVTLTTVGFGDITPVTGLGRIVAGHLMVAGMFTLALFAGVVGNTLLKSVLTIREEQFRMSGYFNHVVICGFETGADMLLHSLLDEFDPERHPLVVFSEGERPASLPPDFVFVSGDPTKESELDKVKLSQATAAILVGSRRCPPSDADARTILTAFTVRAFMKRQETKKERKEPLYVVAEILDEENVNHAYSAGADEVIETRRLGFAMLTHAVTQPGSASIMSKVATAGSHSVFIGALPGRFDGSSTFGEVAQALKDHEGVLLIGVHSEGTGQDSINPPDSLRLDADSKLIYLAEGPVLGQAVD